MPEKVRVFFTIDTETSMGGAWHNEAVRPLPAARTIFGEYGSHSYGIPLIMDLLEEHGFTGTFFIEVFCSYLLGASELRKVFHAIQSRGHDAQLHLHPEQRFYRDYLSGGPRREEGLMFRFALQEQVDLIREGIRLFEEFAGRRPRAYRAGCYGASELTLKAARLNGIEIDSSYNLAFLGWTCGFQQRPLNAPVVLEGVHEFPVTNFMCGPRGNFKPLEISAVSVWEILSTIRSLANSGIRDVVLVFHSFSFLKNRDARFEKCRPDRIVIGRFRKLCSELSRMRDEVEVSVLGRANLSGKAVPEPHPLPSLGWLRPGMRKAVQGLAYIPWI